MEGHIEHVIDCSTGQGVDRDYEGTLPGEAKVIPDPAAERRRRALLRLKIRSASEPAVADLLIVLGLDE